MSSLPGNVQKYIKRVESSAHGVKVSIISVGPGRNQTIVL